MKRHLLVLGCAMALPAAALADQPSVQVQPPDLHGSRPLEKLTATAVVQDYLESWRSFDKALDQNQAALLSQDFVGTALTRLSATVAEQTSLGIHTRYQDRSHNLQIVFYSPEGLSLQMIDNVEYDEQVFDHDKLLTTQHVHAKYLVVMTPAQVRWQVRIFQEEPQ